MTTLTDLLLEDAEWWSTFQEFIPEKFLSLTRVYVDWCHEKEEWEALSNFEMPFYALLIREALLHEDL